MARSQDPFQADLSEIRAIASGDSAAFQRLIEREAPRLVRFVYGMLGSLDEAEDAVQDTLIRLWENRLMDAGCADRHVAASRLLQPRDRRDQTPPRGRR